MKIVEGLEQGSEAWHDYRTNHIMATDSAVICGDTIKFKRTPLKLWYEKLSGVSDVIVTERMERGRALEPLAREKFTMISGIDFYPAVVESEKLPWAAASLDGISYCGQHIIEIKCPSPENFENLTKEIPSYYMTQMQKQMFVAEMDMVFFFVFDGKRHFFTKIYRNEDYIKQMIEKEKIFFECIQPPYNPPQDCKDDYELIDDPELIVKAMHYKEIKRKLATLELEEKMLRMALTNGIGNRNAICGTLKFKQVFRKGNIDYASVPELQGVDLEQYRKKPIEYAMIKEINC